MTNKQGKTLGKKILGVCEVIPANKKCIKRLLHLCLNSRGLHRIDNSKSFSNRFRIWVGFNLMFKNMRVNSWHLFI
jgi:hypothetical protein